jgi:RNA 2',3'-cyclic 3'-phosphodiesterase
VARDRASRPEAKPLRLFVAVDIPADVKDGLDAAIAPFRTRVPAARWTRRDGWHVTLKFLGHTWPRLVDEVRAAVATAGAGAAPFESALTEIGVFTTPARARVVWAGLSDPDGRFGAVARRLDQLLEGSFVPEKRDLTPHLTLARINPPRDIREFAPELPGLSVASRRFQVEQLVLYRSHLSPRGASYEAVERAPLTGDR